MRLLHVGKEGKTADKRVAENIIELQIHRANSKKTMEILKEDFETGSSMKVPSRNYRVAVMARSA
jgi:hypothetical protein